MNCEMENHGGSTETTTYEEPNIKGWRMKVLVQQVGRWMKYRKRAKWLDDMRGNLSLIATVIATMTFQMALNPPGGVRSIKDDVNPCCANANPPIANNIALPQCTNIGTYSDLCPGEAILAVVFPSDYYAFLFWNTMCFVASLSTLLLLVSGLPLNHRFPMWILTIVMWLTLTSLAFTYIKAVQMVTPDPVWGDAQHFQKILIFTWVSLLLTVALILTLRIIVWGVNYFKDSSMRHGKMEIPPTISREIASA